MKFYLNIVNSNNSFKNGIRLELQKCNHLKTTCDDAPGCCNVALSVKSLFV